MLDWLMKMMDPAIDVTIDKLLTRDYDENHFVLVSAAMKLFPAVLLETTIRGELGKELKRPFGSPLAANLSPWDRLLLNPKQLFQLPTATSEEIKTETVIGPRAAKPLSIDLPLMISAMSYGASVSLPFKIALAKGSALAGTATNTGESTVTEVERQAAKYLIGQYNRGGFLTSSQDLKQVDAIEVQLGQAAWGGAVTHTLQADELGRDIREAWHLKDGENATIYARMPGVSSVEDIIRLVQQLKREYQVPVGIKIAASDFLELDLKVVAEAEADFLTLDGAGGGTAGAPPTLEDNLGLPTLYALVRAADWLREKGLSERISLIISGGLKTPGHYLKALALGATAVNIGSIAVIATLQSQMCRVMPKEPPTQLVLYRGKLTDQFDVEKGSLSLSNYLASCLQEMKLAVQAMGKTDLTQLNREDLVAVDRDLAETAGVRFAGERRPPE